MRKPSIAGYRVFIAPMILLLPLCIHAQVMCGTANENGTVTLTAPAGHTFTSIDFASYGTPGGSCGGFTIGGCHSASSATIVQNALVGRNSASINATNGVFGDPCVGTVKRLYIQAKYSAILPVSLGEFTVARMDNDRVLLRWSTEEEVNSSRFVIETSGDGIAFKPAGSVAAAGQGKNDYQFMAEVDHQSPVNFFRLRMEDQNGKFTYSDIVRYSVAAEAVSIRVHQNPAGLLLLLTSSNRQSAVLYNGGGMAVKKIMLHGGKQQVDISTLKAGVYYIKGESGVTRFIRR